MSTTTGALVTTFVISGLTYGIYKLVDSESPRERLVRIALADVGKAGVGPVACAQVGYPNVDYKAWCQIWILAKLREARLTDVQWQIGKGFVGQLGLPVTGAPKPGDLAYWHSPRQHMGIVVSGGPDLASLTTVDGAQAGDLVDVVAHRVGAQPVYYSIERLVT